MEDVRARSNPEGDRDHSFCATLERLTEVNDVYGTHIQMLVYIPRAYRALFTIQLAILIRKIADDLSKNNYKLWGMFHHVVLLATRN